MTAATNFTLSVADNLTVYIDIQDNINLRIKGSYNDTVKVSLILSKQGIKAVGGILTGLINTEFEDGLSVNAFIQKTKLGFFNLTELELTVFDHYASIALTPQFDRMHPKAL